VCSGSRFLDPTHAPDSASPWRSRNPAARGWEEGDCQRAARLWSSGPLAWDDLKIVGVNGTGIEMTASMLHETTRDIPSR
jgi:hypothetical protein